MIFSQSLEKRTLWYPADYFSGENAIKSQSIIINEEDTISIYKNFSCDSLKTQLSFKKGINLPVEKSYIEFLPGTVLMLNDTSISCDYSNKSVLFNIGDTLSYYVYAGEGFLLVGKDDCTFEIEMPIAEYFKILTGYKILGHSVYIKNLNVWIKVENNNHIELKTEWWKTY